MSRFISIFALLGVIAIIGALFYRVMSTFLLPLFLAALLAALFHPVYRRFLEWCGSRRSLAAGLTTATILTIVLLPVAGVVGLALFEAQELVGTMADGRASLVRDKLDELREKLKLDKPDDLTAAETIIAHLHEELDQTPDESPVVGPQLPTDLRPIDRLYDQLPLPLTAAQDQPLIPSETAHSAETSPPTTQLATKGGTPAQHGVTAEISAQSESKAESPSNDSASLLDQKLDELKAAVRSLASWTDPGHRGDYRMALYNAEDALRVVKRVVYESQWESEERPFFSVSLYSSLVDVANPSQSQIDRWLLQLRTRLKEWLPSITGQATALMTRLAIGVCIMAIAMFYFLADGSTMIRDAMRLSPLDDRYELELLKEFDTVSRAVVMATLLSAMAQALLAGIGYLFVGLDKVFLLTLLTGILALVPFVGAAAVWIPACLWLGVINGNVWTAVGLAVYCAIVVSNIDNIIKPYILHGQSKLHPLLALLSVLGGLQTLGPVGLVVGPMVVSFLQALLNMLHGELSEIQMSEADDLAAIATTWASASADAKGGHRSRSPQSAGGPSMPQRDTEEKSTTAGSADAPSSSAGSTDTPRSDAPPDPVTASLRPSSGTAPRNENDEPRTTS